MKKYKPRREDIIKTDIRNLKKSYANCLNYFRTELAVFVIKVTNI